jgi:hypothetical protein
LPNAALLQKLELRNTLCDHEALRTALISLHQLRTMYFSELHLEHDKSLVAEPVMLPCLESLRLDGDWSCVPLI